MALACARRLFARAEPRADCPRIRARPRERHQPLPFWQGRKPVYFWMRKTMKLNLERIELREIELPLKYPFETSFGRTTRRRIMIVRVFDQSGTFGYGECTAPEDPFFNHETIDTAWLIVANFVAPLLGPARIASAADVNEALARIRGNRM